MGEGFDNLTFAVAEVDCTHLLDDVLEVSDVILGGFIGLDDQLFDIIELRFILGPHHLAGEIGFTTDLIPYLTSDTEASVVLEG